MSVKQIKESAYRSGGFIGKYQRLIKDEAEGAEKSGVVENFINAGMVLRGETPYGDFYGMVFQDSDAAKWLEAAAYSLANFSDSELEEKADRLIDIIAAAQDKDGYLNTRFTISDKEKRWTNLLEAHELYCAGHMMEAACAYYEATGKNTLLNVMLKNTDCIYERFIINKNGGCPGHPEVELALMKMYRLTGEKKCLELAKYFIDERGRDADFYNKEAARRDWTVWNANPSDTAYMQGHLPVREQSTATGHAVRAVYLYTGMAELAAETGDKELLDTCKRLWDSITKRQMYVTGGIGSTVSGEAFSVDYDLPSDTAYAETCAAIGLIFFGSAMLKNEIDGKYGDICERAFYNGVLAGMALDGKSFFYVNPLEVIPGISGKSPNYRHDLPQRPKWYACACCPPNVARLVSSFGKYAYGESSDTVYCHMFADGDVTFENGVEMTCETNYPYDFTVCYKVKKAERKVLAVRIPGWSKKYELLLNGKILGTRVEKGYAYIEVTSGDEIKLVLDGTPRFVYPSSKIHTLTGSVAVMRGPLVYCFEGKDNEDDVISLSLKTGEGLAVSEFDPDLLGGTVTVTASAVRQKASEELYSDEEPQTCECKAVAVPYYVWGNRGEGQMRVWMDKA
ncbi:MAG: glycoside hydrolase family 127 protein [Ruminococcaceae bacterium]|nr:glycoside hydrolase family 127 protein [Oscillospiraceae bacterium]